MSYIGITLIIAILIGTMKIYDPSGIGIKDIEYISYVIILVQISALTILFGFIIMLYPIQELSSPQGLKNIIKPNIKIVFILITLILIYSIKSINIIEIFKNIYWEEELIKIGAEKIKIPKSGESIKILKTIGELLYTDNNIIIKLIILTLILLIAIVAIFYII